MTLPLIHDHAVFQVRGGLALLVFKGTLSECLVYEDAARAKQPNRSWWTETL